MGNIEKKMDDELLNKVSGGTGTPVTTKKSFCPQCNKETTFNLNSGGRAICQECGYQKFM